MSAQHCNRRYFLGGTLSTVAAGSWLVRPAHGAETKEATPPKITRRLKLGIIGCGGRGNWIGQLFTQHGGYDIHAVADYFPSQADQAGDRFGVDAARRFSGLAGYRRLLETDIDAVAIETPPYFHPEQAAAAVAAGKHVFCAKPVAVDVPGSRTIEDSGRAATANKLAFLVDFQTRADEFYTESIRRVHAGDLGQLSFMDSMYHAGCPWGRWIEPLRKQPNDPETRLRAWGLCKVLSGDIITEQNIHTLDVVSWIAGTAPTHAVGQCGRMMRPPVGTSADHFVVLFQYADGVGVTFSSRQSNGYDTQPSGIRVRAFGARGVLETQYGGNTMIRGEQHYRGGRSPGIFREGATANVAAFYRQIVEEDFSNPTVEPSVQSNLLTILGREAAYRGGLVSWDDVMSANTRLEADLEGLKA